MLRSISFLSKGSVIVLSSGKGEGCGGFLLCHDKILLL